MQIELTEQQARSVAQAARIGLEQVRDGRAKMNQGDVAAAYVAAERLEAAVVASVGKGRRG